MLLAIDVGNSNIVFGCIQQEKIHNIIRVSTRDDSTPAEFAVQLKQLLEIYGINLADIDSAIISSVVPAVTEALKEAVTVLIGKEPMIVGPGIKTGMNVRIDDPGTLAGDLVVGSVAAMVFYGTPCIVLDMGTASTMVVIDKNKNYLGGAIMPGVKLSYNALAAGTSLLPDIAIGTPKKCVATNTVDSLRSGAIYGTAAMIDGMIDRMTGELGYECKVVATGGLAQFIAPYCKNKIICDDNLLLKGLWYLYNKNK